MDVIVTQFASVDGWLSELMVSANGAPEVSGCTDLKVETFEVSSPVLTLVVESETPF